MRHVTLCSFFHVDANGGRAHTFLKPLLSHFRLARRNVPLRLAPHLSYDGGYLQAEVYAADGGHGRPGHRPGLPLHLVRQPISPAVLQLWDNDR